MVELALLEKGLPFEYVLTFPEQTPEFLARSPRGKVPFLGTPQGFINETDAILDNLEDIGPSRRLLPEDPQARATVRGLMKEIELYIDLPARSCFAEAFFGGSVPAARTLLQRLGENPHVKVIAAKRDAGMPAFVAAVRARSQGTT